MLLIVPPLILVLVHNIGPSMFRNSTLLDQLQVPLATLVILRLAYHIKKRYEILHSFDDTNIPTVGNPNPFSGNLFKVILRDDNLKTIHKYHEKLGKTFGLFYSSDPWVMTTDLDLVHKLFVSEGSKYIDTNEFHFPFTEEVNHSLVQVQGNEWRQVRRLLNPSFTAKQMKSDNVSENINQVGDKTIECIQGHEVEMTEEGASRVVDVLDIMKRFGIEVIFRVAYGKVDGINFKAYEEEPLVELTYKGSNMIGANPMVWVSIMFPKLKNLIGALAKHTLVGKYAKHIHGLLSASLEARRKLHIEPNERKMIDSLMEAADENKLTDTVLKSNLFFFFLAGFETTSNTASLALWMLARHPEIQDKVRESIMADGEQSELLDFCIKETLRLYPAVPTGVGRVVSEDFEYKGLKFKTGMTINASLWSIHHSCEYWGDDVEEFRPERFLQPLGHTMQYTPFAHGPRYCIGQNLALSELRIILTRILVKYKLLVCDTTPKSIEPRAPNIVHMIIDGKIDLKLVELSSL